MPTVSSVADDPETTPASPSELDNLQQDLISLFTHPVPFPHVPLTTR